jgi:hypothetical protein
MTAGSVIYLKPGFNAINGSEFHAAISSPLQPDSYFNAEKGNFENGGTDERNIIQIDEAIVPFTLDLYPNPCKGTFNLVIGGELQNLLSLVITDIRGHVVYQKEQFSDSLITIDISRHPKGVYIIKAISRCGTFSKKVIYW